MRLQAISQKKKEYDLWRDNFREWVKQQREEQSLAKRQQVAAAVQEAFDRGHTVAEIMRAYGTTDRKTITDLINLPLSVEATASVNVYQFENIGEGLYRINDLVFKADDTEQGLIPYVEGPDAETDLGIALNNWDSDLHKEARKWLKSVTKSK